MGVTVSEGLEEFLSTWDDISVKQRRVWLAQHVIEPEAGTWGVRSAGDIGETVIGFIATGFDSEEAVRGWLKDKPIYIGDCRYLPVLSEEAEARYWSELIGFLSSEKNRQRVINAIRVAATYDAAAGELWDEALAKAYETREKVLRSGG